MEVTKFMSQSKSSTISHSFALYNLMLDKVEKFIECQRQSIVQRDAAEACLEKMKQYYALTDSNVLYVPSISNTSFNLVLNPCYKLALFKKMGFEDSMIADYKDAFQQLYLVILLLILEIRRGLLKGTSGYSERSNKLPNKEHQQSSTSKHSYS